MTESFEQNPNNPSQLYFDSPSTSWVGNWLGKLNAIRVTQRANRDALALTYGSPSDLRTMTYARASFLLVWNGKGGGFFYASPDGSDPSNPAWTTPIGRPLAPSERSAVRTSAVLHRICRCEPITDGRTCPVAARPTDAGRHRRGKVRRDRCDQRGDLRPLARAAPQPSHQCGGDLALGRGDRSRRVGQLAEHPASEDLLQSAVEHPGGDLQGRDRRGTSLRPGPGR